MPYVIAQPCVDVKDKACVDECPVDCIYEGSRSLYINPNECVDCGACEPVCPTSGLGTRMPLSTSSLKSAIWAALPPMVQSAKTRNRSPRCRRRTSKLICG
mgnify:CR=1 FL=1